MEMVSRTHSHPSPHIARGFVRLVYVTNSDRTNGGTLNEVIVPRFLAGVAETTGDMWREKGGESRHDQNVEPEKNLRACGLR